MSSDERARILRMVAEGKLSAEEAADLLDAVEPPPRPENRGMAAPPPPMPAMPAEGPRRSLVINISEDGESKVNVRIPLGLARAAGRFVPRQAREYLENYDIDLQQLLADLGSTGIVGPLIEVQDEGDQVRIAVE